MRERIQGAQARLQATAAAGDYQGAAKALDELLEAVEEAVRQGMSLEDPLSEVLRDLERARRLILAARAHDAARLARLKRLPVEYGGGLRSGSSIQVQA